MKILCIDDSRTMRLLVRRAIAEAGYADAMLLEAACGADAVSLAVSERPDLVCCDVHLADMNGFDVLGAMREVGCRMPFGFVTSDTLPETRERAMKSGAVFFINKPFKAAAFEAALQSLNASAA